MYFQKLSVILCTVRNYNMIFMVYVHLCTSLVFYPKGVSFIIQYHDYNDCKNRSPYTNIETVTLKRLNVQ